MAYTLEVLTDPGIRRESTTVPDKESAWEWAVNVAEAFLDDRAGEALMMVQAQEAAEVYITEIETKAIVARISVVQLKGAHGENPTLSKEDKAMEQGNLNLVNGGIEVNGAVINSTRNLAYTPALFGDRPYLPYVKADKYKLISTADTLKALSAANFTVVEARQANTRIAERKNCVKHSVVLRKQVDVDRMSAGGAPDIPEVVIMNSHDGTSAYNIYMGVFSHSFGGSTVVGDSTVCGKRLLHKGNRSPEEIVALSEAVTIEFETEVLPLIEKMKGLELSFEQCVALAKICVGLRYPKNPGAIDPLKMLEGLEVEGADLTMWNVYSRIQNRLVEGNVSSVRGRKITALRNPARRVRIQRELWNAVTALIA